MSQTLLKGTVEGAVDQLFCSDGENGGKFHALQRSRKNIGQTARIHMYHSTDDTIICGTSAI